MTILIGVGLIIVGLITYFLYKDKSKAKWEIVGGIIELIFEIIGAFF